MGRMLKLLITRAVEIYGILHTPSAGRFGAAIIPVGLLANGVELELELI
jgi:hypothetical protein